MNLSLWLGLGVGTGLLAWGAASGEAGGFLNTHGISVVIGGTLTALLAGTPMATLVSSVRRGLGLFMADRTPTLEAAMAEVLRLAQAAQDGGGLLSIQDEARDFAEGFLHRCVRVAIACGETSDARRVLEEDIRQRRILRNEDANVYRTAGMLSPMFGILGTLIGMIQVLSKLNDPSKVGPAMALALSSAFLGIAIANILCIPLAGQIRMWAMKESLVLEVILEGVLNIALGRPPIVVEMRLASYLGARPTPAGRPK
ncbi:MAG: MotA/TolQ/ExbB proton channel family protein [Elusimicrobia bacterium]|nr:MotA/TolQ/ExbB proton channel family protein [Elusimicrobiota bacterium]